MDSSLVDVTRTLGRWLDEGRSAVLATVATTDGSAPRGLGARLAIAGPEEWVGTTVEWDLRQDGDHTIVLFRHQGWREPVEFMHHCSTKWATYLMSLKSLVETGQGAPAPHDLHVAYPD